MTTNALSVPSRHRSLPFVSVLEDVYRRAEQQYPDRTVPLRDLRATPEGLIDVPGIGELALTDWSRSQLSRMLGIRWDRWFKGDLVSPEERADEINRRLHRQADPWKIRSTRHEAGDHASEGVLRAFLGAGYAPIDDHRIFDRLSSVLHPDGDYGVVRVDRTDRVSHYVITTTDRLEIGLGDLHLGGFILRNSEVGSAALTITEYLYRLVCTNGLVVGRPGDRLFHRVHRTTSDESIDRSLAYAFARLPDRIGRGIAAVSAARAIPVLDIPATVEALLAPVAGSKALAESILTAYSREPEPTRWGLLQAMTLAAQALAPEDRVELETLAGSLLTAQVQA